MVDLTNSAMGQPGRAYLLLVLIRQHLAEEECIIPTAALHKLPHHELELVLPHLVALACQHPAPCVLDFLEFICRYEFRLGLIIRWAFEAMLPEEEPRLKFINVPPSPEGRAVARQWAPPEL